MQNSKKIALNTLLDCYIEEKFVYKIEEKVRLLYLFIKVSFLLAICCSVYCFFFLSFYGLFLNILSFAYQFFALFYNFSSVDPVIQSIS